MCYIYWNTRWAFSSELMDMEEGLEGMLVVEEQTPTASGMKVQTLEQRGHGGLGEQTQSSWGVCAMCVSVSVWVHTCV